MAGFFARARNMLGKDKTETTPIEDENRGPREVLSENTRKLRFTFSKIIPNFNSAQGVAAFYCDKTSSLCVFSLLDGELMSETVGSDRVVEVILSLQCGGVPLNKVDPVQMRKITMGFTHIASVENESHRYVKNTTLEGLRTELSQLKSSLKELFEEKYG